MEKTNLVTTGSSERRKISRALMGLIIAQAVLLVTGTQVWGGQIVKKVNCDKGQTITHALQGFDRILITIQVKGICDENVEIDRDDVTLIADPSGGTVKGIDPNLNTITINGARTVIDGLTVTGGRSGIVVSGDSTIRNCAVQDNLRVGIGFLMGGKGTVDNCTIQSNARYGIVIQAASATVINSAISLNISAGISVGLGGSARIGVTDRNEYAGNTISNNGESGIMLTDSASASIGGNTINGNGTNPIGFAGGFGIYVVNASATLVGNNSITGNGGTGVFAHSSSVKIGVSSSFPPPLTNVITGNGATFPAKGGVFGELGASLDIRDATIDGNYGNGVTLTSRSTAWMFDATVNNNTGNGILLHRGGGLVLENRVPPNAGVTVTGHLVGLQCNDAESSYAGDISGINGQVNCSGF